MPGRRLDDALHLLGQGLVEHRERELVGQHRVGQPLGRPVEGQRGQVAVAVTGPRRQRVRRQHRRDEVVGRQPVRGLGTVDRAPVEVLDRPARARAPAPRRGPTRW